MAVVLGTEGYRYEVAEGWVSWDTLSLFEQLMGLGDGEGTGFLTLLERFQAANETPGGGAA